MTDRKGKSPVSRGRKRSGAANEMPTMGKSSGAEKRPAGGLSGPRKNFKSNETSLNRPRTPIASRGTGVEVEDLIVKVEEAIKKKDKETSNSLILTSVNFCKLSNPKTYSVAFLSLLLLCKRHPDVFREPVIVEELVKLLQPSSTSSFRIKGNPFILVLACHLLLRAHQDVEHWPLQFISLYLEDIQSERAWCESEMNSLFVANIATAFQPEPDPKEKQKEKEKEKTKDADGDGWSDEEIMDEGASTSTSKNDALPDHPSLLDSESINTSPVITPQMLHHIAKCGYDKSLITNRYPESSKVKIRKLVDKAMSNPNSQSQTINLLASTVGCYPDLRLKATKSIGNWLNTPKDTKWMGHLKKLLSALAQSVRYFSRANLTIILNLVNLNKLKGASYKYIIETVIEILRLNQSETRFQKNVLEHILNIVIENTQSEPVVLNLVHLFSTIIQELGCENLLAGICRQVLREYPIERCGHIKNLLSKGTVRGYIQNFNSLAFVEGLIAEKHDLNIIPPNKPLFAFALQDLMTFACCMIITNDLHVEFQKNTATTSSALITNFQKTISAIQGLGINWFVTVAPGYLPVTSDGAYLSCVLKFLFMINVEEYDTAKLFPSNSNNSRLRVLLNNIPVLQSTIYGISILGSRKIQAGKPLQPAHALNMIDSLVKRALSLHALGASYALVVTTGPQLLLDSILGLTYFQHNLNMAQAPQFLLTDCFWQSVLILLRLGSINPTTLGTLLWQYPTFKVLMEMVIIRNFNFPPMVSHATNEVLNSDFSRLSNERAEIIEFERSLAALDPNCPKDLVVTSANSKLVDRLMHNDFSGPARRPPKLLLDQISQDNLRGLLCSCRGPIDFLVDIMKRSPNSSDFLVWLIPIIEDNLKDLRILPIEVICEIVFASNIVSGPFFPADLAEILVDRLRVVSQEGSLELIDFFLERLSSPQASFRMASVFSLQKIFQPPDDRNGLSWLSHRQLQEANLCSSLINTLKTETNSVMLNEYINHLCVIYLSNTGDSSIPEDIARFIIYRPLPFQAVAQSLSPEQRAILLLNLFNVFEKSLDECLVDLDCSTLSKRPDGSLVVSDSEALPKRGVLCFVWHQRNLIAHISQIIANGLLALLTNQSKDQLSSELLEKYDMLMNRLFDSDGKTEYQLYICGKEQSVLEPATFLIDNLELEEALLCSDNPAFVNFYFENVIMGTRVLDIVIRTFCETWLSSPAPLRSILENLQQKFSQDEIQQAIGRQYTSASRLLENLQCLTKDEKEKYEIYFKELLAETEEVQTQEPESDSQFLADDFFDLPVTLPVSVKIETEDQNTECTDKDMDLDIDDKNSNKLDKIAENSQDDCFVCHQSRGNTVCLNCNILRFHSSCLSEDEIFVQENETALKICPVCRYNSEDYERIEASILKFKIGKVMDNINNLKEKEINILGNAMYLAEYLQAWNRLPDNKFSCLSVSCDIPIEKICRCLYLIFYSNSPFTEFLFHVILSCTLSDTSVINITKPKICKLLFEMLFSAKQTSDNTNDNADNDDATEVVELFNYGLLIDWAEKFDPDMSNVPCSPTFSNFQSLTYFHSIILHGQDEVSVSSYLNKLLNTYASTSIATSNLTTTKSKAITPTTTTATTTTTSMTTSVEKKSGGIGDNASEGPLLSTLILDFVMAVVRNPQAGRSLETTQRGDIGSLCNAGTFTSRQAVALSSYAIDEMLCHYNPRAKQINDRVKVRNDRVALLAYTARFQNNLYQIVTFLNARRSHKILGIRSCCDHLLAHLYILFPKMSKTFFFSPSFSKISSASTATISQLDVFIHRLISVLTSSEVRDPSLSIKDSSKTDEAKRTKKLSAEKKLKATSYSLFCNLAQSHPVLILPYLKMMANGLKGRTSTGTQLFIKKNLRLYTQILGILDLLRPHIFDLGESKRKDFRLLFEEFIIVMKFMKTYDLTFVKLLSHWMIFLRHFFIYDALLATEWCLPHFEIFSIVRRQYPNIMYISTLTSLLDSRRLDTGPKDQQTYNSAFVKDVKEQLHDPNASIENNDLWDCGNDLSNKLQGLNIEQVLEFLRNLDKNTLFRDREQILEAVFRCISSSSPEVQAEALDKTSELVISSSDYVEYYLQTLFSLSFSNIQVNENLFKMLKILKFM